MFLSFLTVVVSVGTIKTYQFFYSPIAGVTTANSLNDNISNYAVAKFIRDGGVESLVFTAAAIVLLAIWVLSLKNKSNNTPSK